MRILQINSVCGIRSTGRIATDLADVIVSEGYDCKIGYGRENVAPEHKNYAVQIGTKRDYNLHALGSRFFDRTGFYSVAATKRFLAWAEEYKPNLIHLHNIHGYYINIELLFHYIQEHDIPVVWTLHDCWAFTGHCAYFTGVDCEKWKNRCERCCQRGKYPASLALDRAKSNYDRKRKLFTSIKDMTIVTPSHWLAGLVRQSFLGAYPIAVIPSGIDLNVFQPTESNLKAEYGLENKKVVMGAATAWGERKGLNKFIELQKALGNEYQVVLVGMTEKEIKHLPVGILGIPRTNHVAELAALYSMADVFVNAGREETMGMTTVEAMACGTPVAVSNLTAVPEVVHANGGLIFQEYTTSCMVETVRRVINMNFNHTRKNALEYGKETQYKKYLEIYAAMLADKRG